MNHQLKSQFEFMCQLHQEAMLLVTSCKFDKSHPWHRNLVSLYGSMLELLGSTCILIQEEAHIAIPILLRSFIEAYLDFVNLASDKTYGFYMDAAEAKEWIKILGEAKTGANPFLNNIATDEEIAGALSQQKEMLCKLGQDGYNPLSQEGKFIKAKLSPLYRSVYNSLCCDAHNNLRSLVSRHINLSADHRDFSIEFYRRIKPEELYFQIALFCNFMISATGILNTALKVGNQSAFDELRVKYSEIFKNVPLQGSVKGSVL